MTSPHSSHTPGRPDKTRQEARPGQVFQTLKLRFNNLEVYCLYSEVEVDPRFEIMTLQILSSREAHAPPQSSLSQSDQPPTNVMESFQLDLL